MKNKRIVTRDNFYTLKYTDREWLSQRTKDALSLINQVSGLEIFSPYSKVLDVGCGSGELGHELTIKYGCKIWGMDINKIAIKKAKKLGVKARIFDIDNKWPYKNSSFNVVCATEIIEHVFDPDHFLEEAYRVLKKEGFLVIATPNLAAWFNRLIFLFGYQPFFLEPSTKDKTVGLSFTRRLTENREPVGHIRCFTLKAMKDILKLHNFEIINTYGNSVYYLPSYIKPFDIFFKIFPSLATEFTIISRAR